MNLEDFINQNREKALSLDITDYPVINNVLQKQKLRPSIEFIKKAIDELENNLINCLVNNNHVSDKSKTPSYLWDISLLLEYRKLRTQEDLRLSKDVKVHKMKQDKGFKATYTKQTEQITAKYDLDEKYYNYVLRLTKCKTNGQRRYVADVPYPDREQAFYSSYFTIDGAKVFNAFVADFLFYFPDHIPAYKKNFRKGKKHFNKTYKVKTPALEQVKVISDLYNNELKVKIYSIPSIYSTENIKILGFENGLLSAYARFEDDYKAQFEELLKPQQNEKPQRNRGRKKADRLKIDDIITNVDNDRKKAFLDALKKKYINSEPKEFIYLLRVLDKGNYLRYTVRKSLFDSFEGFFENTFASTTQKNNYWNEHEDGNLFHRIKMEIDTIKQENIII